LTKEGFDVLRGSNGRPLTPPFVKSADLMKKENQRKKKPPFLLQNKERKEGRQRNGTRKMKP
jgi:hypothetical protein